ncbi:MAG: AAA family ATPase [Acholeplasmatales bacterium]|jgi:putative ATPase|nr:AAA family ATPase [Acholeplasmatales bacterium]
MEPLSYFLRPTQFNDIVSHQHLIGPEGIFRKMIASKKYFSFILYGNPGVGKTTIAKCFCLESKEDYYLFNASTDDKNKLKQILDVTYYHSIILIVDEIHRMNNNIQEVLLPYLEAGKVYLIGLTTLSPYHAVNIAIRSRCQIFELKDLLKQDIITLLQRAVKDLALNIEEGVFEAIAQVSNNEARSALNLLETLLVLDDKNLTLSNLTKITLKPNILLDKNQDYYYELLSALQKSIRGSDVDASLYYLAKLITLGDLKIIQRRLMVIAYEDIGLANPNIGLRVNAALEAATQLGFPEACKPLANIVIEMALSVKSNTANTAIENALEFVQNNPNYKTPNHAINAKIKLNPQIYHYPHNDSNSLNDQSYLPIEIKDQRFYFGKMDSDYEKSLVDRNEYIKKIKKLK